MSLTCYKIFLNLEVRKTKTTSMCTFLRVLKKQQTTMKATN